MSNAYWDNRRSVLRAIDRAVKRHEIDFAAHMPATFETQFERNQTKLETQVWVPSSSSRSYGWMPRKKTDMFVTDSTLQKM